MLTRLRCGLQAKGIWNDALWIQRTHWRAGARWGHLGHSQHFPKLGIQREKIDMDNRRGVAARAGSGAVVFPWAAHRQVGLAGR